jgi:hypothetical protein
MIELSLLCLISLKAFYLTIEKKFSPKVKLLRRRANFLVWLPMLFTHHILQKRVFTEGQRGIYSLPIPTRFCWGRSLMNIRIPMELCNKWCTLFWLYIYHIYHSSNTYKLTTIYTKLETKLYCKEAKFIDSMYSSIVSSNLVFFCTQRDG